MSSKEFISGKFSFGGDERISEFASDPALLPSEIKLGKTKIFQKIVFKMK